MVGCIYTWAVPEVAHRMVKTRLELAKGADGMPSCQKNCRLQGLSVPGSYTYTRTNRCNVRTKTFHFKNCFKK